jgi:hypothetical protein
MLLIILLAIVAVCTIVVVGLHQLHRIPYRPPTLFT